MTAVYLQVAQAPQVQYLLTWIGLIVGVAIVLAGAFWLAHSIEHGLAQLHDEDAPAPSHPVVVPFRRRGGN